MLLSPSVTCTTSRRQFRPTPSLSEDSPFTLTISVSLRQPFGTQCTVHAEDALQACVEICLVEEGV